MSLPAQVLKQKADIDKFYSKEGEEPDGNEEQASDDEQEQDDKTSGHSADNEGKPQEDSKWEQKYKTLQGMYNADVNRLRSELAHVQKLVADFATNPAPQPKKEDKPVSLLSQKDIDDYGESIEVMRKVFTEQSRDHQKEVEELKRTIGSLQGVQPQLADLVKKQSMTAEQLFLYNLERKVPDWQAINGDSRFLDWLTQVDDLTGLPRQALLEDAESKGDVDRVARFFASWKQLSEGGSAAAPKSKQGRHELESQIAPGKSRSVETNTGSPRSYTRAEISQFYREVTEGKYRGRDEEKKKKEADIFLAQTEGRIK